MRDLLEVDVVTGAPAEDPVYHAHRPADGSYCSCTDPDGNWHGHWPRSCGEHRTCGGRAWCHDCREWCYERADMGCIGCIAGGVDPAEELIRLRGVVARVEALCDRWRDLESYTTTYRSIQAFIRAAMQESCVRCGLDGPFNSDGRCQDCASPGYT